MGPYNSYPLQYGGKSSAGEFADELESTSPIQMTADGQISRGALFTTDPHEAEAFVSLLVVSENLQGCRDILGPMGSLL